MGRYDELKNFSFPNNDKLRFTKELTIQAPFVQVIYFRCFHHSIHYSDDIVEQNEFEDMAGNSTFICTLIALLRNLRENELWSFKWHLGICLPVDVITEYLCARQNLLRELSVIMDEACKAHIFHSHRPSFNRLQSLSWRGFGTTEEVRVLGNLLMNHALHLEELVIQPLSHNVSAESVSAVDHLIRVLMSSFKQQFTTPRMPLLALRSLSLHSADIELDCVKNLFEFTSLDSLTLQSCRRSEELLRYLVCSDKQLDLKRLEYVGTFNSLQNGEKKGMVDLLEAFRGLKDLFLRNTWGLNWKPVLGKVLQNHSGLQRLVVLGHGSDVSASKHSFGKGVYPEPASPYMLPSLRCLGVSLAELTRLPSRLSRAYPWQLGYANDTSIEVEPKQRASVEILHIRPHWLQSEGGDPFAGINYSSMTMGQLVKAASSDIDPDVREFAQWAFSSEGLPNLKVLAFGNFARVDPPTEMTLLCKNTLSNLPRVSSAVIPPSSGISIL